MANVIEYIDTTNLVIESDEQLDALLTAYANNVNELLPENVVFAAEAASRNHAATGSAARELEPFGVDQYALESCWDRALESL